MSGPFGRTAHRYFEAGWPPIPVAPGMKGGPGAVPRGVTGADGQDLSAADVLDLCEHKADHGVAVRAPIGVVGIDVDQYGAKCGWDHLEALRLEHGLDPLPPTWRSSARPSPSGIYWYRLPQAVAMTDAHGVVQRLERDEIRLEGAPVPGVEIIQRHHRYAVAWPTVHPTVGEAYRWHSPRGAASDEIPRACDLAELPEGWVQALGGRDDAPTTPADYGPAPIHRELEWSPVVTRALEEILGAWRQGTSRHDAAVSGAMRLARLERLGEAGATGALDQLGAHFVAELERDPGTRRGGRSAHEREWADALGSARHKAATTASTRPTVDERAQMDAWLRSLAPTVLPPPAGANLPEEFWAARPALEHIRQAAHSRIRSADLVLHAVLARLCSYTPHTLELPALVGSPGSLNFFTAAIGPSGAGKSSGVAVAAELVPKPSGIDIEPDRPLGSGEGIAEGFMGTVLEEGEGGKKVRRRRQVRFNAFIYGDEGAALTAMMERSGATLPEAIRRAWNGAALGQANASDERTRVIPAGQYRLAMLVGFQPELAARLLADADAGTPQRFVWAMATDASIPDEVPPWPGPLSVPALAAADLELHRTQRGHVRHTLGVADEIAGRIRRDALALARGDARAEALDSHRPLHLLKVSGLLAILDGRLDITTEDWRLAEMVWSTSCQVRAGVVAAIAHAEERTELARVERHARRERAAEAARSTAQGAVERLAQRLGRWAHERRDGGTEAEGGWSRRDLGQRLKGRERELLDAAIERALAEGWIDEAEGRYTASASRPA